MTGRSQIWDGGQWINLSNNPGSKGETGATGPPGTGGDVSSDAGNQAILGTDSLVYVPDFADGVYLKLSGGTMQGVILGDVNADASLPAYAFNLDEDTGMYRAGANRIGWAVGGNQHLILRSDFLFIGPELIGNASIKTSAAGTAASPSYSFHSDSDIGMYRVGTNDLGFSAGGGEVLRINATRALFGGLVTGVPVLEYAAPSESTPAYTFFNDLGTGMFRVAANQLGFSTQGVLRLELSTSFATFTIPVVVPVGNVGQPQLTFVGDTDTGIYHPQADEFGITAGGIGMARWKAVGTSSQPESAFNIRTGVSGSSNALLATSAPYERLEKLSSAAALKQDMNVMTIPYAWDQLAKLIPKTFRAADELFDDSSITQAGFIMDDLIATGDDSLYGTNDYPHYNAFVTMLVRAVDDLRARIETLEP